MPSTLRRFRTLAALLALPLVLAACDGGSGTEPEPEPELTVKILPGERDLLTEATLQLQAEVTDTAGAPSTEVPRWSTSAPGVAAVSESGVVTGVAPGTATIRAEAGTGRAEVTVEVVAPWEAVALTAPAGSESVVSDLNEAGVAVGSVRAAGGEWRAVVWTGLGTGVQELGEGRAMAVSEGGRVAGEVTRRFYWDGRDITTWRPVVWQGGVPVELDTLDLPERVTGINDRGEVVGWSLLGGIGRHTTGTAVLWRGGERIDLGQMGATSAQATDINDAGQVVGTAITTQLYTSPWVWSEGAVRPIPVPEYSYSEATEVTPDGRVLVRVMGDLSLWKDGASTPLGKLTGTAADVNAAGVVVGSANDRAVVLRAGALLDLNRRVRLPEGWHLTGAVAINDTGWIAANATHPSGATQAYLIRVPN